jgi:hypothetical protein
MLGTWIRENNSKKWAHGLRFVQFQKNSCHHRVIKHSPYSVLFGHEPKIGLASTSLPSSIFGNLTTEEELLTHLGIPTDTSDAVNQNENEHESKEEQCEDEEEQVSESESEAHEEINSEEKMVLRNDRVRRTNNIRQVAREGQKRQADEFLQNTQKKHKQANINIGDNVVSFLAFRLQL